MNISFVLIFSLFTYTLSSLTLKTNTQQAQCKTDSDCNSGKCKEAICYCHYGYTDMIDKNGKFLRCAYLMKSQLKAFILELFLGFGAGHFYCGRIVEGSLKLTAFSIILCFICIMPMIIKKINEVTTTDSIVVLMSCVFYISSMLIVVWYIYDLVQFGMNKYNDGNDMPLQKWGK